MNKIIIAISAALIALSASAAGAEEIINGAGASFPAPVYQAWAYQYNKTTGAKLNYQSIGSGGGQRQITEKTLDFGASDDPLKPEKLKHDNLLQFPAVIGGVVPIVNIKGIKDGQLKLDSGALCKIFLGEITSWDDDRVKNLNPGMFIPHTSVTVIYRSDGSGTTAIFTNYLSETCPGWKSRVGAGKAVKFPAGIGGKGNEGVANYVKRTQNTIGYVEFAYAKQNKLVSAQLKNRAGNFVAPGFDTFAQAAESGDFDPKKDFYTWLINTAGKGAWPIAGATFILLAKDQKDANMKTVKFFDWAFTNGDAPAKNLAYLPLPESLKDKVRAYWKANGLR